jgi:hypothetical protein
MSIEFKPSKRASKQVETGISTTPVETIEKFGISQPLMNTVEVLDNRALIINNVVGSILIPLVKLLDQIRLGL